MSHDARASRHLAAMRAIARVMDEAVAVPGTRIRVGLDAIVGLLPGLGDAVTGAIALYAILAAARLGAPPAILGRMAANVLVDTVVGAVPILGDIFDVGWKSNSRNAALLERYLREPQRTARSSRFVVVGILAGTLVVVAAAVAGALWIAATILRRL